MYSKMDDFKGFPMECPKKTESTKLLKIDLNQIRPNTRPDNLCYNV